MSKNILRQNFLALSIPASIIYIVAAFSFFMGAIVAGNMSDSSAFSQMLMRMGILFGIPESFRDNFIGIVIQSVSLVLIVHSGILLLASGFGYLAFSKRLHNVVYYRLFALTLGFYAVIPLVDGIEMVVSGLKIGSVYWWMIFYAVLLISGVAVTFVNTFTRRLHGKQIEPTKLTMKKEG